MRKLLILSAAIQLWVIVPVASAQSTSDKWSAFEWSEAAGANSIKGSALLRTRGGDVKTCAGFPVRLLPSAPLSDEYVEKTFGSPDGGLSRSPWRPQFGEFVRQTTCDAQGNFEFTDLPDGKYYAIAFVSWDAVSGYRYPTLEAQGGLIAQSVRVRGGQIKSVVVTQ